MATIVPLPSVRGSEAVLLIEEDDLVRKMVAGILTADGYHDTAVGDIAQARRVTAAHEPVQLLIGSLAGDGEKFARRLHPAQPDLRILGTSNSDFKMPVAWLPPEHQACLNKPCALNELLRATRALLDA